MTNSNLKKIAALFAALAFAATTASAAISVAGKATIYVDNLLDADTTESDAFYAAIGGLGNYAVYGFEDQPLGGNPTDTLTANVSGQDIFTLSAPGADAFDIIAGDDGKGAFATEGEQFLKIGRKPSQQVIGTEFVFDMPEGTPFIGFDLTDAVETRQFGTTELVLTDLFGVAHTVVLDTSDVMDMSGSAFFIGIVAEDGYSLDTLNFSYDNTRTGSFDGIGIDAVVAPVPEPATIIAGIAVLFIAFTGIRQARAKRNKKA